MKTKRYEIQFTDGTIWYMNLTEEQHKDLSVASHVRTLVEV